MEPVLEHLREFQTAYIITAVCLLPILFVTRRYSIPLILYTIEIIIYLCLMHVSMWCIVGLTRWFREQSSMRALQQDGRPVDAPDWGTPLLEFWNRELYKPEWVVWMELVLAVIIVIMVFKYRPMKLQRKRGWHFTDKSEKKPIRGATGRATARGAATRGAAGRPGRR